MGIRGLLRTGKNLLCPVQCSSSTMQFPKLHERQLVVRSKRDAIRSIDKTMGLTQLAIVSGYYTDTHNGIRISILTARAQQGFKAWVTRKVPLDLHPRERAGDNSLDNFLVRQSLLRRVPRNGTIENGRSSFGRHLSAWEESHVRANIKMMSFIVAVLCVAGFRCGNTE